MRFGQAIAAYFFVVDKCQAGGGAAAYLAMFISFLTIGAIAFAAVVLEIFTRYRLAADMANRGGR
jgi:hypothetical protein